MRPGLSHRSPPAPKTGARMGRSLLMMRWCQTATSRRPWTIKESNNVSFIVRDKDG